MVIIYLNIFIACTYLNLMSSVQIWLNMYIYCNKIKMHLHRWQQMVFIYLLIYVFI